MILRFLALTLAAAQLREFPVGTRGTWEHVGERVRATVGPHEGREGTIRYAGILGKEATVKFDGA